MHLADFQGAFRALCRSLDRDGLRWEHYMWALDCRPHRGHLHRHVLALGGPFLPRSVLAEHAQRAGLGYVDVRRIGPTAQDRARVSAYIASAGVRFAAAHAGLESRIRPFAISRSLARTTPTATEVSHAPQ